MTLAVMEDRPRRSDATPPGGLRFIVLSRLAVSDGATRSELNRELGPIAGGPAGRLAIDIELAALVRAGTVMENRSRFKPTADGQRLVLDTFALKLLPNTWAELRDTHLVALALDMTRVPTSRLKQLSKPDGLRAAILVATYGIKLRAPGSPSKLRAELALVALERAFGNKIKSGLPTRGGFNAKSSRILAGQLLAHPRDAGTDSRLVTALAAEAAGSTKLDAEALRTALLRRLAGLTDAKTACGPEITPAPTPAPAKARNTLSARLARPTGARAAEPAPATAPALLRPPAATRPDLAGFAAAVQTAARTCADGWAGNQKALVSRIWRAISAAHPGWGLSAIEFKAMLAEAHRTGHLVLATADLRDKSQLKELQDSAITYKNTVWHQVRVQD